MTKPSAERRYRRRTVRVLVAFRGARGAEEAAPSDWERAYATTLGAGGLFVECAHPPRAGSALELRFRIEPGGPQHALTGRVAWIQPPDDPPAEPASPGGPQGADRARRVPGMGIEFTEPAERRALAAALARMAESPQPRPTGAPE